MAFAAGSIVAAPNLGGGMTDTLQPQPPLFGIIASGADPYAVLWHNAVANAALPSTALDEIVDADAAEVTRLAGKIVRLTTVNASPEYDSVVIAQYKRDLASSGVPGPNLALVKSSSNGFYYEVQSAGLAPVAGR